MSVINRPLGAVLLIAGTAIGAGMIAMPVMSYSLGPFLSTILLVIMWFLMFFTALVMVNILLYLESKGVKNLSIPGIAEHCLGKFAGRVSKIATAILFYSLLAAYLSGISSIIRLDLDVQLNSEIISLFIVLVTGLLLFISNEAVDFGNRIFFLLKSISFIVIIYLFLPNVEFDRLSGAMQRDFRNIWVDLCLAIPVFFTAFGFHGSIPSIFKYLLNDKASLAKACFIGSFLPFLVFLSWQFMVLGAMPSTGENSFEVVVQSNNNIGVFIKQMSLAVSNRYLTEVLYAFSCFAIITSFFGVSIGLFDFFTDIFGDDIKQPLSRLKCIACTFAAPLFISIFNPMIFISAIAFAAIFLTILAIIIPSLSAIAIKKREVDFQIFSMKYSLYWQIGIYLSLITGSFIIIIEIINLLKVYN